LKRNLLQHVNVTDYFTYLKEDWDDLLQSFSKKEIVEEMASLVEHLKLPFPWKQYDPEELKRRFLELYQTDASDFVLHHDDDIQVMAAFDYAHGYDQLGPTGERYGLFMISQSKLYTALSDAFQQKNRYACDSINSKGPLNRWNSGGEGLRGQIGAIWRMGVAKSLNKDVLRERCKVSAYYCSQFRPGLCFFFHE